MADTVEVTELLDVDVDEIAGMGAFGAAHRLFGIEVAHAAETRLAQHSADRCGRQGERGCDLLAGDALAAQGDDLLDHVRRRSAGHAVWPRAAVGEARLAFGPVARQPLGDGPPRDTQSGCNRSGCLAQHHHAPHDLGSTVGRGSGILVDVHPVVPPALTRSEEHTSELQSLMRISYAVFCLKKKKQIQLTRRASTYPELGCLRPQQTNI